MATRKNLLFFSLIVAMPFACLVFLLDSAGSNTIAESDNFANLKPVSAKVLSSSDSYIRKRTFVGRLEVATEAQLGFELAGLVKRVLVDEGDAVGAGQLLAELDNDRLRAQEQELIASLSAANADEALTQKTLHRIQHLNKDKLASRQDLNEAEESHNKAKARRQQVIAQLARVRIDIKKSNLYAPFDGRIAARKIDQGTVVNAGTILFSLTESHQGEARFGLPQAAVKTLAIGTPIDVVQGDTTVAAKIKQFSPLRNPLTRTIDVLVKLDNVPQHWRDGDLLRWLWPEEIQSQGFWIPQQALADSQRGLWTVNIAVASNNSHQIESRIVEVLHVEDDKVFIRGAIDNKELLVVHGNHRIVPKQWVSISNITEGSVSYAK